MAFRLSRIIYLKALITCATSSPWKVNFHRYQGVGPTCLEVATWSIATYYCRICQMIFLFPSLLRLPYLTVYLQPNKNLMRILFYGLQSTTIIIYFLVQIVPDLAISNYGVHCRTYPFSSAYVLLTCPHHSLSTFLYSGSYRITLWELFKS